MVVDGLPIPQGAVSAIGPGRSVHTNAKRLKPWRKQIARAAWAEAQRTGWTTCEGPVRLAAALFAFPRPANHYRTGRFRHLLRDDAPHYPTGSQYGDVDHLVRAALDAFTASGVIADDKLVVGLDMVSKEFADPDPPGATFTLVRVT